MNNGRGGIRERGMDCKEGWRGCNTLGQNNSETLFQLRFCVCNSILLKNISSADQTKFMKAKASFILLNNYLLINYFATFKIKGLNFKPLILNQQKRHHQ